MELMKPKCHPSVIARGVIAGLAAWSTVMPWSPAAGQFRPEKKPSSGTFVSYTNGTLTLKGKTGLVTYEEIGANFKAFENNEEGPGSKPVNTVEALGRAVGGTVFQIDVEAREIRFGLDCRVIGAFASYEDGSLKLLAVDVPPGFIGKPAGDVELAVDPATPVLESVDGADYRFAGSAGEVLPRVKAGTLLAARSEFDADTVEVIQIGQPKRTIERYIGQTRATVRGTFVGFKDGVLKIQGKGVSPLAANEYARLINLRIPDHVPIVESIDGEAYAPADPGALRVLKEGTIVTVRKVEEVILEVQIGVASEA